jgi:hypothetical protein
MTLSGEDHRGLFPVMEIFDKEERRNVLKFTVSPNKKSRRRKVLGPQFREYDLTWATGYTLEKVKTNCDPSLGTSHSTGEKFTGTGVVSISVAQCLNETLCKFQKQYARKKW